VATISRKAARCFDEGVKLSPGEGYCSETRWPHFLDLPEGRAMIARGKRRDHSGKGQGEFFVSLTT